MLITQQQLLSLGKYTRAGAEALIQARSKINTDAGCIISRCL